MDRVAQLKPQLAAWSRSVYGGKADVADARSLGGHSAITIGFDVLDGGRIVERLVLKIAPPGVNRQNNFDVLRQVPLLQALERHGIPAPKAAHWSANERYFGAPFLMMSRLEGEPLPDLFGPDAGKGVSGVEVLFEQPIQALAALHRIDAQTELADWNVVRLVPAEIDHWVQVFRKSSVAEWIELAERVCELLHRNAPAEPQIGLVHGDFYSNNWVFAGRHLSGVVDWEGSSIGPSLLDLGWVAMMYDIESWGPMRRRSMGWHPGPDFFIEQYRRHAPRDPGDLSFWRALAGYRLASITTYYFERHRTGKVNNPAWEVLGESVPYMYRRAARLLEHAV